MAAGKPTTITKIAIVGGGMGGLTAAFELSNPIPDNAEGSSYSEQTTYEITVYQEGWRLGGKAASGRNDEKAHRIEEHGLHVWMGFYENAFRMLRKCYAELQDRFEHPDKYPSQAWMPPRPFFQDWTEAFFPDHHVGVAAKQGENAWESWTAWFPPTPGLPGDPLDDEHGNPFTLTSYLQRTLDLLKTLMLSVLTVPGDKESEEGKRSAVDSTLDRGRLALSKPSPRLIVDTMTRMLRVGTLSTAAGLLQAVLILEHLLKRRNSIPGNDYKVLEFLEAVAANTRRQLEDLVKIDPRLRRKTEMVDLVMTCVVGILRDDLLSKPNGLDAIDHLDAREWLEKHGATYSSLQSPIMNGLYDMAFADVEVKGKRCGRLSAAQALRCALRLFYTYRGSLFWRMQSSMADVVVSPLYQVLKARGVKFSFFHRLESIKVNYDNPKKKQEPYIEALEFDIQAQCKSGEEYFPLIDVNRLQAWPSRPDYEQLKNGAALRKGRVEFESFWDRRRVGSVTKKVKVDFDYVVLAVGLGVVEHVAGDLMMDLRWRDMVANIKTVATQAFQVWLREDMTKLGWDEPPVTLSAFEKPFDTWSDMTHVLPTENWLKAERPLSVAYFCGALENFEPPGRDPRASQKKGNAVADMVFPATKERARDFLDKKLRFLWPGAMRVEDGTITGFEWKLLVDPARPTKSDGTSKAFDSQYWMASLHPSDRYVLSVPGSASYRISPLDDTYANLTVAGDWVACGFVGGCVEAAVMAGRLAAHSLSGAPLLHEIIGYDHP